MPDFGSTNSTPCASYEVYDQAANACFRYVFMTPTILSGVVIGLFLLFVTWIGLSCLMAVETPPYLDQQVDEKVAKERARLLRGREF